MATTNEIIERFGGQSALARLIGKRPSTVQYWAKAGRIPAKWQPALLELASTNGVILEPRDFAPVAPEKSAAVVPSQLPEALWAGILPIGNNELPVYVLSDGRRLLSRTGATTSLTGTPGGDLLSYIRVTALQDYMPPDIEDHMVEFSLHGVTHKTVRGITADIFLDICRAYVGALNANALQTDRQRVIAAQAAVFLAACADVGLSALIDEVTGFQLVRAADALQVKLNLLIAEEMRPWEKTFPDELWAEFGRLTNWRGPIHQRPKYWGKLVNELIYDYLDSDVAAWLRENAPKPRHGQNYHQWLTDQYGLKKLVEHIWMVIGMARACQTMWELRRRMAEQFGRHAVQLTMFLDIAPQPRRGKALSAAQGQLDRAQALDLLERESQ